jgi:hypothetical protein
LSIAQGLPPDQVQIILLLELADNTLAEEPQGGQQEQPSSNDPQAGSEPNSSSMQERDGRPKQQSAGNQPSNSSDPGSSMINKLKDSMANLLSMAKAQPGGSGKRQMAKAGDGHSEDSRKQGAQGSNPR